MIAGPVRLGMAVAPRPSREIKLLKMDCEGCEYKIYDEVAQEADWKFFERVHQIVLEVRSPSRAVSSSMSPLPLPTYFVMHLPTTSPHVGAPPPKIRQ